MDNKDKIQYRLQTNLSDYELGFSKEDENYFYYMADTEWGDHLFRVNKITLEVSWRFADEPEEEWELSGVLDL